MLNSAMEGTVRALIILLAVLLAPVVHAEDTALAALRMTLLPMRAHSHAHEDTRGATARITAAKHRLRVWVEARLSQFPPDGDETGFVRQLNGELAEARLFCDAHAEAVEERCDRGTPDSPASSLGYLHPLKAMRRAGGVLVIETGFAIQCGEDTSAYAYEWRSGRWRLFWQSEQAPDEAGGYMPQSLNDVLVADLDGGATGNRLLLTLGHEEWCNSYWHRVYYRLWRTGYDGGRRTASLLLDRAEIAYLGDVDGPLYGRLQPTAAFFEFVTGSMDGDVNFRDAVRHYRIAGNSVTLGEPIALGPREFVEEWLVHPWPESASWSASTAAGTLRRAHRALHKNRVSGSFLGPTLRCDPAAALWQVGFRFEPRGRPARERYFIVRWRPEHSFAMVEVLDRPRAECSGGDAHVDDFRRLMPAETSH
jgi:hypothetical protein